MSDDRARAKSGQSASPDERLLTIPLSVFNRACLLSRTERWVVNVLTLLWVLGLVAAEECVRFKLLSVAGAVQIAIAATVFRFAAIKIYLVVMRPPMSDMPLRARVRHSYLAMRGRTEGAVRTLSIVLGLSLIGMTILSSVDPNVLRKLGPSWNVPILIVLLVLFVAAVIADVLIHRWYARNAKDSDPPTQMW